MLGDPLGVGLAEGVPAAFRVRVGLGEPLGLDEGAELACELLAEAEGVALGLAVADGLGELLVVDGLGELLVADGLGELLVADGVGGDVTVEPAPDGDGLGWPDGGCSGTHN